MDENKDFSLSEQENENIENTQTDTITEETSFFKHLLKKLSIIQAPIKISFLAVFVVFLSFTIYKCFFNTSICGVWTFDVATSDEAKSTSDEAEFIPNYLIFDDNDVVTRTQGTMTLKGTYSVYESEDGPKMSFELPYLGTTEFNYNITGNIFTGRTLNFSVPNSENSIELISTNYKKATPKPYKNFKPNKKIIGKWKDDKEFNEGFEYNYIYEFKDDGTAIITQNNQLIIEGVYTSDKNTIKVSYLATENTVMDLTYEFTDDGILVINKQLGYSKVTE